jgi:hypothetical protein
MLPYFAYLSNVDAYIDNPAAEECISAFFKYLKINMCPIDDLDIINADAAVQYGLVFLSLNPYQFNKGILRTAYKKFMETRTFDSIEFSIASSAGLFLAIGAKKAQPVDPLGEEKHDLNLGWTDHVIQAEVIQMNEEADFSLRSVSVDDTNTAPNTSSLLIIDANPMKHVFPELGNYLKEFFPSWPHISGVSMFTHHLSNKKVGWQTHMLINPHARRPFDKETAQQIDPFKRFGAIVAKKFD